MLKQMWIEMSVTPISLSSISNTEIYTCTKCMSYMLWGFSAVENLHYPLSLKMLFKEALATILTKKLYVLEMGK